jgi:hypothetical protein
MTTRSTWLLLLLAALPDLLTVAIPASCGR